MRSYSLAALGLATIALCSTGCVYEYQAVVRCTDCEGTFEAVSGWQCSQQAAIDDAKIKCGDADVTGSDVESRLVFDRQSDCTGSRVVAPSAMVDNAVKQARRSTGSSERPQPNAAADGPTCPPKKLDVKVTVFQDVPVAECPGPMGIEVSYQKYISAGVFQSTTLSATVPVGGNHEFTCLDAGTTEFGKVGTISVRVYSDLNCVGEMPLAIGQAYSEIPADGSRLEVRANLQTLQFDDEVVPPANPVTTPANAKTTTARRQLVPIPDPRFISGK